MLAAIVPLAWLFYSLVPAGAEWAFPTGALVLLWGLWASLLAYPLVMLIAKWRWYREYGRWPIG